MLIPGNESLYLKQTLSQNYLGKLIIRHHNTKLQFRFYVLGSQSGYYANKKLEISEALPSHCFLTFRSHL